MPRTNRYFMPGRIWHITHRCHERKFLLKFRQDRKRWIKWLLQARLRYGLSVLNYGAGRTRLFTLNNAIISNLQHILHSK
jgi:putative transposase